MLALFLFFNLHPSMVPYLKEAGGGELPLDMRLTYTPEQVHSLFTTYETEGRQRYRLFLIIDLAFPVFYGLFWAAIVKMALRPPAMAVDSRWQNLCLLPLLTGAADWSENLCILGLLAAYPAEPRALACAASMATTVKWLSAVLGLLTIAVSLGLRRLRRRRVVGTADNRDQEKRRVLLN